MQVPTMKTMVIYSDFEGMELQRVVLDFLDKKEMESYDYERGIIYSYSESSHSAEYHVQGAYSEEASGEIYEWTEDIKKVPFVRFRIVHVLEFNGHYFAQTPIEEK